MASSGLRKILTLVNINTLHVLVLMCSVIFKDTGVVVDGMATGYGIDNYLSCGRCLLWNNDVGRYCASVADTCNLIFDDYCVGCSRWLATL